LLDVLCGIRRRAVLLGQAVDQTRDPIGLTQADPFGDCGAGDLEGFSYARVHRAALDDKLDEFEGLRGVA
jgi:hypothetical protein